jgi:polyisoprenoid-binding protein YceI
MIVYALVLALLAPAALHAQSGARSEAAAAPAPSAADVAWSIDKAHSEMTFVIRHLISRVRGTFREWQGTLTLPDAQRWEEGSVDVTVQTASIFTDHVRRDNHLRTSDFFLADSFPTISFRSTRVERMGAEAKIHGMLTIRGVTRPVTLDGRFLGHQRASSGAERIAFEAATTINRLDYGVAWNRAVEGGGVTLGDDVRIEIAIQAVRPPPR